MRLVNRTAVLIAIAAFLAGCGGSGRSVPMNAPTAAVLSGFKIPASLPLAVPPNPPNFIPAKPSMVRRTRAVHASFFAGEATLSNGVYYLALPNGNPFGYYSYLPDANYIYHFDAGYEYVYDANDGKGGVYFYDFASGHWWYTGRQYPFPYIYDFRLNAFLYYYPNTSNAGHYTTNPRYFYNFTAGNIIAMPTPPSIPLNLNVRISWANTATSASSFSLSLDVFDSNQGQLGHTLQTEKTAVNSSGVRSTTTDNIAVSYPQGQGATYALTVNGPGVPNPCTMTGGSGPVIDAYSGNPNAYPTVSLTCN